ncbi:MAG: tryptophan-rich sensory protein [Proteobacteria bacterium]|nr:tryptophan-rich sensory protein [Pseudomonadota bacterium]
MSGRSGPPAPLTRTLPTLGAALLICYSVAALGAWSTVEGVREWYPGLDKPPWTPPNWMFGPIWSVLYTAMAVGVWDALRRVDSARRQVLGLFVGQLALNALWSPLFFALHWAWVALAVISVLWAAILACIVVFRRSSSLGAALYVPYLAWITVAWSLNAWIAWFNP